MEKYKRYSIDYIKNAKLSELTDIIKIIENDYKEIATVILDPKTIIDQHQSYVEKLNDLVSLLNKVKQELFEREKKVTHSKEKLNINEMIQSTLFINSSLDNLLFELKIRYNNNKINLLSNKIQSEVEEKFKSANNDFNEKLTKLSKKVEAQENVLRDNAEKKIFEAEKKVFNNSMTYMSILAALIAIIASVISTSSSWLNSANNNSVIIAFIIPALVLLVAVIFLLSFSGYLFADEEKEKEKKKVFGRLFVSVGISIVLFSLIVLPIVFSNSNKDNKGHTYYIIDSDGYQIIDNTIEFSFNGLVYSFTYDETKIHDGKIKYCIEHNELE